MKKLARRFSKARLLTCMTLMSLSIIAQAQIPREDVLECGLSDGSKFILKAKYEWNPLHRILRHTAERINQ
jgi:hypothetical protein